jgi:hypothetical protein
MTSYSHNQHVLPTVLMNQHDQHRIIGRPRTNQHESFQHVLSPLAHFLKNLPEGHISKYYSKQNTLNYEVLICWVIEKNMHLVGIDSIN